MPKLALGRVQAAVESALQTISQNLITFGDCYPGDTTAGNVYSPRPALNGFAEGANYGWTTSFWPGLLWLAYGLTGDAPYRQGGEWHIHNFARRVEDEIDLDTHDLGFLYSLSCVAPYRIIGHPLAKQAALQAAERLMARYLEKIGVFQAWGMLDDARLRGNTIIDSLMNMPLLYWASQQTGEPRFAQAAYRHATRLRDDVVRVDDSTFHTFYWDVETGAPLRGSTAQGYADDSCWARGQAWAIYGFTLNYRHTSDETFLEVAQRCADYFLAHLPEDQVAYWDLAFNNGSDEARDSSAAAIAVCGLDELIRHLPAGDRRQRYQTAAQDILASLITAYTPRDLPECNALLLHGVYDKPKAIGVDEGCLWGDYFYLEALVRALRPDWEIYW